METNSVLTDTAVVLKYKVGVDLKGNDIFRTQKANDLKLGVTDTVLLDLSDIMTSFIAYPVSQVRKETIHLLSR